MSNSSLNANTKNKLMNVNKLENGSNKSNQIVLDSEYVKLIANETKNFCSQLTQSDIDCKSVNNMHPDLSKQIIVSFNKLREFFFISFQNCY